MEHTDSRSESPRPLSDIVEQLQRMAKSKHEDSLFTGKEFVEEYGEYPKHGIDEGINPQIATAGGDIQTAYSNLFQLYQQLNVTDVDTRIILGKLDTVVEFLDSAITKLAEHDVEIVDELRRLRNDIKNQRRLASETGGVVM